MRIHRSVEYIMADEQAFRLSNPDRLIYMDWEHSQFRYWIFRDGRNDENNESGVWVPTPEDLMADDWQYFPCECPIYKEFLKEDELNGNICE